MICEWNLILLVWRIILGIHTTLDIVWKTRKGKNVVEEFFTRLKCYLGNWLTVRTIILLFSTTFTSYSLETSFSLSLSVEHTQKHSSRCYYSIWKSWTKTCVWNIWKPLSYEEKRRTFLVSEKFPLENHAVKRPRVEKLKLFFCNYLISFLFSFNAQRLHKQFLSVKMYAEVFKRNLREFWKALNKTTIINWAFIRIFFKILFRKKSFKNDIEYKSF